MVTMANDLAPAYILHRRKYRDSSLILEMFTPAEGKIAAIAKGVMSGKRSKSGSLQPFYPLWVGWSGRGEIKTLTKVEPRSIPIALKARSLYCGFYINELLMYLIQRNDPQLQLFELYETALHELGSSCNREAVLRKFELKMLTELGYQLELQQDITSGKPLDPEIHYEYRLEVGPVPCDSRLKTSIQGATLIKLANNQTMEGQEITEARNLMRRVINFHLDGRPLKSRELFQRI